MGDRFIWVMVMSALIGACSSSSQVLTGMSRAAVSPDAVRVYTRAPARFEEIAVLKASSRGVSTDGGEHAIQKVIRTMKAQAAQLGANGLLLEDFSDARPGERRDRRGHAGVYAQCFHQHRGWRLARNRHENRPGKGDIRGARKLIRTLSRSVSNRTGGGVPS